MHRSLTKINFVLKIKKWTDHFLPLAKWEAGLRETMRIATTAASVGIIDVHYLLASTADS